MASPLEPAIVTLGTVYVMVWGYLQLPGRSRNPSSRASSASSFSPWASVAALELWLYNSVIVDTFFNAPGELAAGVVGAYDPVGPSLSDLFSFRRVGCREASAQKGGGLQRGLILSYFAGFAVVYPDRGYCYCVYCHVSAPLSRLALSVRPALGPLFIALAAFFEPTKRFFESWIAQSANYAFVTILTVLVAALMMDIVDFLRGADSGARAAVSGSRRPCAGAHRRGSRF